MSRTVHARTPANLRPSGVRIHGRCWCGRPRCWLLFEEHPSCVRRAQRRERADFRERRYAAAAEAA